MIDINLTGQWKTVKAAIPPMIEGGRGGSIILTSSLLGVAANAGFASYAAAKHGVVGLMRTLALELGPHKIRANSIHPCGVNTPMLLNDRMLHVFRPDLDDPSLEEVAEVLAPGLPLGIPWLEPQDVTDAVLWLASDESRYITGVTLPIDAGYLLKH
jgi:(+)-trans-carveol dehydrogenase